MAQETLYDILGVKKDATEEQIKKAYRKLVRSYHPDVSDDPKADEMASKVNAAYQVLKDKEKRAQYDAMLENPFAGKSEGGFGGQREGFSFSHEDLADIFAQRRQGGGFRFDDLFSRFAGATRGQDHEHESNRRGEDQHAELTINIADAYRGATRKLVVTMPTNDGYGRLSSERKTLHVKIPKGIREGQQIRLAGQGMPGDGGNGDLFIRIRFAERDRCYVDKEKDVYQQADVAPWTAALGGKVAVETPAGKLSITLPPGTSNGKRLRLKGKGIPAQFPGDLYLVVNIMMPPVRDATDEKAWRQLAAHYGKRAGEV